MQKLDVDDFKLKQKNASLQWYFYITKKKKKNSIRVDYRDIFQETKCDTKSSARSTLKVDLKDT